MTLWLVKWKFTQQYWSKPDAERGKILISFLAMVKADMDSGLVKESLTEVGADTGYRLMEGSEAQVYEACLKYNPYYSFEFHAVIPYAQMVGIIKRRAATLTK